MGKHIDFLPACLNPDASEAERKSNQRYVTNQLEMELLKSDEITLDTIANNYPFIVHFYPTEDTLAKLIKRSTQITDIEEDLWGGYQEITHNDGCK